MNFYMFLKLDNFIFIQSICNNKTKISINFFKTSKYTVYCKISLFLNLFYAIGFINICSVVNTVIFVLIWKLKNEKPGRSRKLITIIMRDFFAKIVKYLLINYLHNHCDAGSRDKFRYHN